MSNLLKVAMIDVILSLHRQGLSQRRIASELGINRETVARYLSDAKVSKPANAPTGSTEIGAVSKPANAPSGSIEADAESKPANAPSGSTETGAVPKPASALPGSATPLLGVNDDLSPSPLVQEQARRRRGRTSHCEPWRDAIQSKCDLGLSAQRIYQDLVVEHSFTGTYYSVRRFVRQLTPPTELPFRRMECGPGEEAQVDFGTGARVVGRDGKRKKTHLFRIVLSHSRKAYSEVVYRQTTDDFLRCIENAFRQFGGVPRRLILDNLRAAVKKADWYDPELNPKVRSFGEHYGFVFLPTRPYMPRHKGKVENGVGYVQDNALKGRRFLQPGGAERFLAGLGTDRGRHSDPRHHPPASRQALC